MAIVGLWPCGGVALRSASSLGSAGAAVGGAARAAAARDRPPGRMPGLQASDGPLYGGAARRRLIPMGTIRQLMRPEPLPSTTMNATTGPTDDMGEGGMADDTDVEPSEEEKSLRFKLQAKGYDRFAFTRDGLEIAPNGSRSLVRTELAMPPSFFPMLNDQLDWDHFEHPQYIGYISPSNGIVEIGLERGFGLPGSTMRLTRITKNSIPQCAHSSNDSWVPILSDGNIIRRPRPEENNDNREAARVHLSRRDDSVCIELSNCSPLIALMIIRGQERPKQSLKLYLDARLSREELLEESEEILHSFLYELNARNGIIFNAIRPPTQEDLIRKRRRASRSAVDSARFPIMSIDSAVAKLFNFATEASGNPTLAFLTYYQILEHFLFIMIRRAIIRDVRAELFDRKFDEKKDASIMKLLNIMEQRLGKLESKNLRTLLHEGVRKELVKEFLEDSIWGNHFSSKGPINGVRALSANDRNVDLLDQVAERVYKIRNRIVHAKDEPKHGESTVLMPESQESDSLGPDVQLVRFLAMEVIQESQGR
ncbi:hypothetical protein AB0L53_19700 [Nonomuraea sp. NPDC052129]|uniref:hypothetical protein n=1 Tax=Nonomuraea sp. NPDC052129 TaxID=3154651 RepID=UPI00341CE4D8